MARPRGHRIDGERLRQLRQESGLSQSDLATLSGLTVRTVQTAERGGRLSAGSLQGLAGALAIAPGSLLEQTRSRIERRLREHGLAPPPPPRHWLGRDEALTTLAGWLTGSSPPVCALTGAPGIGKSALATVLAERLAEHFEQAIVWLEAPRQHDAGAMLETLVQALCPHRHRLRTTASPGALHGIVQRELARPGRLLVLDDVEQLEQLTALGPLPGATLVVTRRRHVAEHLGGHVLTLGPLRAGESRLLLATLTGPARLDGRALDPLLAVLGGVPRQLELAARRLRCERYTTPAALARRLAADPDALSPAASRQAMREARQLLDAVAGAGAGVFSASEACQLSGLDTDACARALGELVDQHLVVEVGGSEPGPLEARRFRLG